MKSALWSVFCVLCAVAEHCILQDEWLGAEEEEQEGEQSNSGEKGGKGGDQVKMREGGRETRCMVIHTGGENCL